MARELIYYSRTPVDLEPSAALFVRKLLELAEHRDCTTAIWNGLRPIDLCRRNGVRLFGGVVDMLHFSAGERLAGGNSRKVLWYQGLESEESYLKHNSRYRREAIRLLELLCFSKARAIIVPSSSMKRWILEQMPVKDRAVNRIHIIPNLVDSPVEKRQDAWKLWGLRKLPPLTLGYVGSLAPWQCAQEMMILVNRIQNALPDVPFLVLTNDSGAAQRLLEKFKIINFVVRSVSLEAVDDYVSAFTFGLMLRKNHIVNRVSHPIKWLSYWKLGIPIITTDAVDVVRDAEGAEENLLVDISAGITDHQVEQLLERLEDLRDPARMKVIGGRLQSIVSKNWTWDAWTVRSSEVLESVGI